MDRRGDDAPPYQAARQLVLAARDEWNSLQGRLLYQRGVRLEKSDARTVANVAYEAILEGRLRDALDDLPDDTPRRQREQVADRVRLRLDDELVGGAQAVPERRASANQQAIAMLAAAFNVANEE